MIFLEWQPCHFLLLYLNRRFSICSRVNLCYPPVVFRRTKISTSTEILLSEEIRKEENSLWQNAIQKVSFAKVFDGIIQPVPIRDFPPFTLSFSMQLIVIINLCHFLQWTHCLFVKLPKEIIKTLFFVIKTKALETENFGLYLLK